jgi:uncharacterized protein YndB with AHSA1/START domain
MTPGVTAAKSALKPIRTQAFVPDSQAAVFDAWTDPDIVMQWFGEAPGTLVSAEVDLCVGGAWRFVKTRTRSQTGLHLASSR